MAEASLDRSFRSHRAFFPSATHLPLALAFVSVLLPVSPAAEWSLSSPDRAHQIVLKLSDRGELQCEVQRKGQILIEPSPLGLTRDDQDFNRELNSVSATSPENRTEAYELLSGNRTRVRSDVAHRSITFRNTGGARLIVDLAASDEGVAFRYRFPEDNSATRVIQSERTAFTLPPSANGWLQPYHEAGEYTPAYEDYYFRTPAGTPPPKSRARAIGWAFPALFHLPDRNAWVLLTESGTDGAYAACHLKVTSPDPAYRIAFPAANEKTNGRPGPPDASPRSTLPWTMPWRVIVLGDSAGAIAMSTLVTDLAPPSRIEDASWIRPGRSSWSWWSFPEGPNTVKRYAAFTGLAAAFGWEYTLFDGGWWETDLKEIATHATRHGVAPLAWSFAGDFYDARQREAKLAELARGGAVGVKADFWCSDRQEAIAAMHALFEAAARRRMLVNLHGCTLPRGWHRTWPNFVTAEAVLGAESYFYEPTFPERAAELNCILPFTRNVAGPMDYTPVAATLKKFPRQTTAVHELATSLVFNSGIVCYADGPAFFESLSPAVQKILRDAPARWDETRCLAGDPGRLVVFARRTGDTWFVAGLNGTRQPRPLSLDLGSLTGATSGVLVTEGANPLLDAVAQTVSIPAQWQHTVPPQGGFILRLP